MTRKTNNKDRSSSAAANCCQYCETSDTGSIFSIKSFCRSSVVRSHFVSGCSMMLVDVVGLMIGDVDVDVVAMRPLSLNVS